VNDDLTARASRALELHKVLFELTRSRKIIDDDFDQYVDDLNALRSYMKETPRARFFKSEQNIYSFTPSSKPDTAWQFTYFTAELIPTGDTTYKSYEAGVEDITHGCMPVKVWVSTLLTELKTINK